MLSSVLVPSTAESDHNNQLAFILRNKLLILYALKGNLYSHTTFWIFNYCFQEENNDACLLLSNTLNSGSYCQLKFEVIFIIQQLWLPMDKPHICFLLFRFSKRLLLALDNPLVWVSEEIPLMEQILLIALRNSYQILRQKVLCHFYCVIYITLYSVYPPNRVDGFCA